MAAILLLLMPFIVLVVVLVLFVRDLSTGSATITGQSIKHAFNPSAYWSVMLIYLAVAGFACFTAYKFIQNGTECPIFVDRCNYQIDLKS